MNEVQKEVRYWGLYWDQFGRYNPNYTARLGVRVMVRATEAIDRAAKRGI